VDNFFTLRPGPEAEPLAVQLLLILY